MFDDFFEEEEFESEEAAPVSDDNALRPPRENPDMFGNDVHESMLISLYNKNTMPHALIFSGPQGVGKTTMAFRVARFLFKHGAGDDNQDSLFGDPAPAPANMTVSPDDPVFRRVASGGHPDLKYIERIAGKSVVDVDSVRKIPAFLRMTSSEGGWRVVIVDEADTMNRNAQNAILKILEEPPPNALLILICNRLGAMLPTIRSRCRTFHFQPLDTSTLKTMLKRQAPELKEFELSLLAELSDGSMGRAAMLYEEKGINTLNNILTFLEGWPKWDWAKIHPMADTLSKPDSEKAYQNFASIMQWTAQGFLAAKAVGPKKRPAILTKPELQTLENHYSLEQWIEICEKLKDHFTAIDHSNLDKRQGVIGAFAILGGQ